MKNIQSKLIDYIKNNTGTSFVEIEKVFEQNDFDYTGQGAYTSAENNNIVFWYGWNKQAFDVVSELVNEGVIEMSRCESMIYIVDGKSLKLPILNKLSDTKELYWLPVSFKIKGV